MQKGRSSTGFGVRGCREEDVSDLRVTNVLIRETLQALAHLFSSTTVRLRQLPGAEASDCSAGLAGSRMGMAQRERAAAG